MAMLESSRTSKGQVEAPPVNAPAQADGACESVFTRANLNVACGVCLAGLVTIVSFQVLFGPYYLGQSVGPYYVDQAWSWLHGTWSINPPAGPRYDLVVVHGKWFEIYPQFPSVLMLPFVAIIGPGISDTFFTDVLSAANIGLLFLLFEQMRAAGLTARSMRENAVWSVLLYLGSVVLSVTIIGGVWRTAHVVVIGCILLSLLLALRHHYVGSAGVLACAFLTRNTAVLGVPFLLFLAWHDGDSRSLRRFVDMLRVRRLAWTEVPWSRFISISAVTIAAAAVFMWRNFLMFGSPLETGYNIDNAQHYPFIHDGLFSIKYIPANLINDFFNFPHISFPNPYLYHATVDMLNGGTGTCVFLTTPLFLLLFWQNRRWSAIRTALWVTIGLFTGFLLLYYASGYVTFGTRYLTDAYPYVWVLLALTDIRFSWRVVVLGAIAVVINLLGTYQFVTGRLIGI